MKNRKWMAAALSTSMLISSALATTMQRLTFEELVEQSSLVVMGEVQDSRNESTADSVQTLSNVAVRQTLMGAPRETVTVTAPTGVKQVGRFQFVSVTAGAPALLAGQRIVLFLRENTDAPGTYSVVGFNQGLFEVTDAGDGMKVMMPGASQPMTLEAVGEKLQDLQSRDAAPAATLQP